MLRYPRLFAAWFVVSMAIFGCDKTTPPSPEVLQQIKALSSSSAGVRWQAAKTLGSWGPKAAAAASALVKALQDPHWRVRGHAADALASLGKAAVTPLHLALQKKQLSYRRDGHTATAQAVRALRVHLLPAMRKRAKEQVGSARSWSLSAISLLGADAVAEFASLLKENDNDLRASVARMYPALGPYAQQGLTALAARLKDRESSVRQQVLRSLVQLDAKSPKIHAQVKALFFVPGDVRVKIEATKALAHWGVSGPKVVASVCEMLTSPTALSYFHFQLLGPLGALTQRLGQKHPEQTRRAVDVLIRFLQHRLAALRVKAAQALVTIGAPGRLAAPTLLSLLAKEPHLRPVILRALRKMLDRTMLLQLTRHKHPTYRQLAAECIVGRAGEPALFPLLQGLSKDPSAATRRAAIQAIDDALKASPKTPRLRGLLLPLAQADKAPDVRAAALLAYVQSAPRKAPPPARPQQRAKTPTVRAASPTSKPAAPTSKPANKPTSQPAHKPANTASKPAGVAKSPPPALTSLEQLLKQGFAGPEVVVRAAAQAMATWPSPPAALWKAWATATSRVKQGPTIAALWQVYAERRVPPGGLTSALEAALLGHVGHGADKARIQACRVLGESAQSGQSAWRARALLRLSSTLRVDAVADVAQAAADALGTLATAWTSSPGAEEAKILGKITRSLLAAQSHQLRLRGLWLVAALSKKQQAPFFATLLAIAQKDRSLPCREEATEVLVGHAKRVDAAVWAKLLLASDVDLRLHALRALRHRMPDIAPAHAALVSLVKARETRTESRAIALLGDARVKDAAAAIADRLTARAWSTRAHAARALGRIGATTAAIQRALQRATQDIHPKVRQAASGALKQRPQK